MRQTSDASVSPRRPVLPERGDVTVEQSLAVLSDERKDSCIKATSGAGRTRLLQEPAIIAFRNSHFFKVTGNIIIYATFLCTISFFLGVHPMDFYFSLKGYMFTFVFMISGSYWKSFDCIYFYAVRRPYDIGDLIELDPPEESFSPKNGYSSRVYNFTMYHTELVSLSSNAWSSMPNRMLANKRLKNWSRIQAKFRIILRAPVDTHDRLVFENFHEHIERYARDHPHEWLAVDANIDNAIVVGIEYKDYIIEIR